MPGITNHGSPNALTYTSDIFEKIKALGYSAQQASRIVCAPGRVAKAILENHAALADIGIEGEDSIAIAKGGEASAIKAILDYHATLAGIGIEVEDLIDIGSKRGGGPAIRALSALHEKLFALEFYGGHHFNVKHLVAIGNTKGASPFLGLMVQEAHAIKASRFTPDDMVRLSMGNGGAAGRLAEKLRLLANAGVQAPKNKTASKRQSSTPETNIGAQKRVRKRPEPDEEDICQTETEITDLLNYEELATIGITRKGADAIVKGGGAPAIKAILDYHPALADIDIEGEKDLVALGSKHGAAQAIKAILDCHKVLTAIGFTTKNLLDFAIKGGGAQVIRALSALHEKLFALEFYGGHHFKVKHLVAIGNTKDAGFVLRYIVQQPDAIKASRLTPDKIVRICCKFYGGGKGRLVKALQEFANAGVQAPKNKTASKEELTTIVGITRKGADAIAKGGGGGASD